MLYSEKIQTAVFVAGKEGAIRSILYSRETERVGDEQRWRKRWKNSIDGDYKNFWKYGRLAWLSEGKFNHSSQKLTVRRIVLAKGKHFVLWSMYNIVKYINRRWILEREVRECI